MTKLTNDEKIKNVQKRKVLKVVVILLAILTIIFAVLTLWIDLNPIYSLIAFILEAIVSKYREKLDPKEKNK